MTEKNSLCFKLTGVLFTSVFREKKVLKMISTVSSLSTDLAIWLTHNRLMDGWMDGWM